MNTDRSGTSHPREAALQGLEKMRNDWPGHLDGFFGAVFNDCAPITLGDRAMVVRGLRAQPARDKLTRVSYAY